MKIKILYVIENIFFGGGERAFAQFINELDKEKYEIYVGCLPGGIFEGKIKNSARILHFNFRNKFNLGLVYQLVKIIKEKDIQIVHSQGGRADFFARVAARIAKVPAVVSTVAMPVEGYDVGLLRKAVYVMFDRFSERFVDRFIVVSETLRERLIKKHRIPSEKIVKICNGIEAEDYHIDSEFGYKIKDEFSIEPDAKLIGTVGRLVWQKGLTYFIQAIKHIVDSELQIAGKIKFLIIGEGNERKSLEKLVMKLGIENNVIFTGFRKDVKEILQALDIFVLPSIREGQPIILLEAMAMGKPIVATDIEGVNETVVDGLTGILLPPRDPHLLAEAIMYSLKDSKKAQEMGQAGRKIAEEKFNLKDKIKQHAQLYETIIVEKLGAY